MSDYCYNRGVFDSVLLNAAIDADRGPQIEVQTGADVLVRKLDEGRRFETFAPVGIDVDIGQRVPERAGDRTEVAVGDAPTVVGIRGDDVMIDGVEAHVAVARAGEKR